MSNYGVIEATGISRTMQIDAVNPFVIVTQQLGSFSSVDTFRFSSWLVRRAAAVSLS